jgi:hypothetical protein
LSPFCGWVRIFPTYNLWKIGLGEDLAKVWKSYAEALKNSNVKLGEHEDQLLWSINPSGTYVPKLGYRDLIEKGLVGNLV